VYDFSPTTVGSPAEQKETLPSGKLQIDYLPGKDSLLYASYSRGVKAAGFNANSTGFITNEQTPFKSEFVNAYDLGAKFELFDHRLRWNSAVFYYDYHRFQGNAYVATQSIVGNYDGTFYGGETELTASLPGAIRANFGAAYVHTLLKNVPTQYYGTRDAQAPLAPAWTLNGALSKSIRIGSGELTGQWSFDYIDSRYYGVDNNPATYVRSSIGHNLRLTYGLTDQGLEFSAYCNNIFNAAREEGSYDFVAALGEVIRMYAPPRWFGVSVRKSF
jgi:iron complex outermembrane receptor protein